MHRAQAVSALRLGLPAAHTPSQTVDWLAVAVGRLEAWKGSATWAGACYALEFVKAWYPGLDLAQLATFRSDAAEELVAVRRELGQRAAAIAEYAETGFFVSELGEEGVQAPPNWFGLNPDDGEDSAKEIASSDEGEDEESEDGKTARRKTERSASLNSIVPQATSRV